MSILLEQVRRFIKCRYDRRVKGGGHIYILGFLFLMCLVVIFKVILERERLYVTYDMVDDALVESLVSSSICNLEECERSGQTVIYRTLTPEPEPFWGFPEDPEGVYEPLEDLEIFLPGSDSYLNDCYERFLNNLKNNLKLSATMEATVSGMDGVVTIDTFTVYNKYKEFDDDNNLIGYRIVAYTRQLNGMWTVTDYGKNMPVTVYNSIDKTNVNVSETSIVARLSFTVKLAEYMDSVMPSLTEADMFQAVSYQRMVDVLYD